MVILQKTFLLLSFIVMGTCLATSPKESLPEGGCAAHLTAQALGEAWRSAPWQGANQPMRIYNFKALNRVVTDAELTEVALKWMALSQSSSSNPSLMDYTYQFLVALADLRIKCGYDEDSKIQKMMLNYLTLILDNAANVKDCIEDVELLEKLLTTESIFHIDKGFQKEKEDELRRFLKELLYPRFNVLIISGSFERSL